jgi:hypothetical protein
MKRRRIHSWIALGLLVASATFWLYTYREELVLHDSRTLTVWAERGSVYVTQRSRPNIQLADATTVRGVGYFLGFGYDHSDVPTGGSIWHVKVPIWMVMVSALGVFIVFGKRPRAQGFPMEPRAPESRRGST